MKRYDVRLSDEATHDLRTAHLDQGDRWLDRMEEAIRALAELPFLAAPLSFAAFPDAIRQRLEALPYGIRQKVVGQYLVRFTVDEPGLRVLVLRLWPSRRQRRPDLLLPRDLSAFEE